MADEATAFEAGRVMTRRAQQAWFAFCIAAAPQRVNVPVPPGAGDGSWPLRTRWDGPGSIAEEVLDSPGRLSLQVQQSWFVVYVRDE